MKPLYAILVLTSCLFITACEDSIGIIGGADGPTAIFVSDVEKESIKMVNIDGSLYYETDEDSDIKGRCGVMDGELKKAADTFEIPKNDGETNFFGGECYQLDAYANTIEIPIGDDIEIFKKLDTDADVSTFKYCYTLEGEPPKSDNEVTLLILANKQEISFKNACDSLLSSQNKPTDFYVLPIDD